MAGQRDHFLTDALLQTAVADERIRVVIDELAAEIRREIRFGDGHAERVGNALPQRTGGRLDTMRRLELGMPRAMRTQFAESLELVKPDRRIASQIQQRI